MLNAYESNSITIYLFNYVSHDEVIEIKKNFSLKYFLNEQNEKILSVSGNILSTNLFTIFDFFLLNKMIQFVIFLSLEQYLLIKIVN